MPRVAKAQSPSKDSTANLGFEAKLWNGGTYGQDKWAWWQRPFGLAKRARRVRLRPQQPKPSNATCRLAIMNLAIRGIEADIGE